MTAMFIDSDPTPPHGLARPTVPCGALHPLRGLQCSLPSGHVSWHEHPGPMGTPDAVRWFVGAEHRGQR